MRRANTPFRKRDAHCDSRGKLAGKRPIASRPAGAEHRARLGHWEGDTVLGNSQGGACILTLVDRKSRLTLLGKLARRTVAEVKACCYFATPHHSWERGTNENTNGLIRQYLPKRASMENSHNKIARASPTSAISVHASV